MICSSTLEFWVNFRFFFSCFFVFEGCFSRQNFCIALRKWHFSYWYWRWIYIHIYVYIYIYVEYMYISMCVCIHVYICIYTYICIWWLALIFLLWFICSFLFFYCVTCFFLWFIYWWINSLSIAHVTNICIYILVYISFCLWQLFKILTKFQTCRKVARLVQRIL